MGTVPYPLSVGQALERIFRLGKAKLRLFVGIASVPVGVTAVCYLLILAAILCAIHLLQIPDPAKSLPLTIFAICMMVLGSVPVMLAFALYEPAASYAALQADLGIEVTLRDAYGLAWSNAGRYCWLITLRYLAAATPILVFITLYLGLAGLAFVGARGGGISAHASGFVLVPLMILGYGGSLVYAIVIMMRLSLAYPACIVEDLTARDALRRSSRLTHGAKGRMFLVALVIYAISYALIMVCEFGFLVLMVVAAFPVKSMHLQPASSYLWTGFLSLFFVCFLVLLTTCTSSAYSTAFAVFYHDRRLCEGSLGAPVDIAG
jgi:hypothetical protein